MGRLIDELEAERIRLQERLDNQKSKQDRNRLGQFATPPALALDILRYAKTLLPEDEPIRFLRRVWQILNQITLDQLLGEGRVYGGGLYKLEPKELANVPVSALADLVKAGSQPRLPFWAAV